MAMSFRTVSVSLLSLILLLGLTAGTVLAAPPTQPPPADTYHIVRWGETLTSIADRYGITVEAIVQANNIPNPSYVHAGVRLLIPAPSQAVDSTAAVEYTAVEQPSSKPSQAITYTVRRGDNLTAIAARFGTTVEAIARANNIRNASMIYVGMALSIPTASPLAQEPAVSTATAEPAPPGDATVEATPTPPPAPPPTQAPPPVQEPVYYTVRWGDTLTSIAIRYGTTVDALVQANNIRNPSFIHAGARLRISPLPAQAVAQTQATATPVPLPPPPSPPPPPVIQPAKLPTPTPPPAPAVALCHPSISIEYPTVNAVLDGWGTTWIKGTARIDDFQFYKLEYAIGEVPFEWFSIGDIHDKPIVSGILGTWNTGALPEGVYQLRLIAVDNRGQFPPPCQVRVIIDHDAAVLQPAFPLAPPVSPSATPTPSPVAGKFTAPAPTASATPAPAPTPKPWSLQPPSLGIPALCHPSISIEYPTVNAALDGWGTTWIKGTARIDDFQFYKLEYAIGEVPFEWFSIGEVHDKPIVSGILGTWNTGALPEGVYQLRLVVVDNRGQFPPPCQVRVIIDHDAAVLQPAFPLAPPVSPSATPTPSPVAGRAPIAAPPVLAPTPVPAVGIPALCNPTVSIAYPTVNSVLNGWGTTWIKGTADIPNFQFYKLEYGIGEVPFQWFSIGEVHRERIVNGILGTWNTGALPEGVYQLRLVAVDNTGNYPPPCQVRLIVRH